MTSVSTAAEQVCLYGASVHRRGLTHGRTGNLSVRVDPDRLLVTPTGTSLGELRPDDLSAVDLTGRAQRPHVTEHRSDIEASS